MKNVAALLDCDVSISPPSAISKNTENMSSLRGTKHVTPSTKQLHFITKHKTQSDCLHNIKQSPARLFYS